MRRGMGELEACALYCVVAKNQRNLFIHETVKLPPRAANVAHFSLCVKTSEKVV